MGVEWTCTATVEGGAQSLFKLKMTVRVPLGPCSRVYALQFQNGQIGFTFWLSVQLLSSVRLSATP